MQFLVNMNIRNVFRFLLIIAAILYIIDVGVDATKSRRRRKKDRRTKKLDEDREARRDRRERESRQNIVDIADSSEPFPTLVQLLRIQQMQGHKSKFGRPNTYRGSYNSEYFVKQFMEKRAEKPTEAERVTVLPVINAKVDFLIQREKSPHFYEPTSTISAITSAELGLVTVHTAHGKYGLHSKSSPIIGRLIHVSDAGRSGSDFGCGNAIANRREIPQNGEPWVALIQRGHCSFFYKIKLAERNNASAVIIYDHKEGEVPKMNTIGTEAVSVSISKHDGHKVARLADSGAKVIVSIEVENTISDIDAGHNTYRATPTDTTRLADKKTNDLEETKSETTSPTYNVFLIQAQNAVDKIPGGNGAQLHNGSIMTTLLTVLSAVLFQTMTS